MKFIKKNLDWIIAISYAVLALLHPTVKFIQKMIDYINTFGSEKQSVLFLFEYMIVGNDTWGSYPVVYFTLLLPVPLVILASYRFHKNVYNDGIIQDEYRVENNKRLHNEIIKAYKRVLIYVLSILLLFFLLSIIVPHNGFYSDKEEVVKAIALVIGFILFSFIVVNVTVIVSRFFKGYIPTVLFSIFGFIIGTLLFGLIVEGIRNAIGIEFYYVELILYRLLWVDNGINVLIELLNGVFSLIVTGYIIHLIYTGDKTLNE